MSSLGLHMTPLAIRASLLSVTIVVELTVLVMAGHQLRTTLFKQQLKHLCLRLTGHSTVHPDCFFAP